MQKRTIIITIAILSIGLLAGIYFAQQDTPQTSPAQEISSEPATTSSDSAAQTNTDSFTLTQVAEHSTANDCWTIVNGNVYDITSYVPRHPGGDGILAACGTDGTSLFTQRQTAEGESVGSGTPHSSSAASQLESLKIGTLSN